MKLTAVTDAGRFISIDGTTIVCICRCLRALDAWYDPPVVQDVREAWGTCLDGAPDSFREVGQLQDVLKTIERYKPDQFPGVPTMYLALAREVLERSAATAA